MQISAVLEEEIPGAICLGSENNTQLYNLGLPASYEMADICRSAQITASIFTAFVASSVLRLTISNTLCMNTVCILKGVLTLLTAPARCAPYTYSIQ